MTLLISDEEKDEVADTKAALDAAARRDKKAALDAAASAVTKPPLTTPASSTVTTCNTGELKVQF